VEGKAPLRILGETAYPLTVASARVRVASFVPFLSSHGIELRYRPTLSDDEYALLSSGAPAARKALVLASATARAARHRRSEDLWFVHRLRLMSPFPGLDPPRALDAYDIDDALFIGSANPVNRRFGWAKQEARRCVECLRRARLVTAGNSFLAGEARRYSRWVEVVPTCVHPARQPLRIHRQDEVVNVGWIGSPTTSAYLDAVVPAFAKLNARRLRAKLVVVGGHRRLQAAWIEHRPWSRDGEPSDLASFDIGIMPLPDTDWARGKCGYKLLQYFSAGVPAVASPVGVSAELVGTDRGLLATTPDEWFAALDELISDVDGRRERGAAARAFVEQRFSYERWAPELAGLFRSLAG
jgi:glycosyltransferase involved in cell wall biosynthesis